MGQSPRLPKTYILKGARLTLLSAQGVCILMPRPQTPLMKSIGKERSRDESRFAHPEPWSCYPQTNVVAYHLRSADTSRKPSSPYLPQTQPRDIEAGTGNTEEPAA